MSTKTPSPSPSPNPVPRARSASSAPSPTTCTPWRRPWPASAKLTPARHLEVAYEAGPCGFGIARRLKQLEVPCLVAAPSLIPKAARLALQNRQTRRPRLARLLRAGELTAVYVPEPTDEAIRDLCRARTDAVDDLRRCRLRLKSFLLRHGYRYQGKANWSEAHMRYLRELVLPHPAMKTILEEYLQGIDAASRTRPTHRSLHAQPCWKPGASSPPSRPSWPFAASNSSPP